MNRHRALVAALVLTLGCVTQPPRAIQETPPLPVLRTTEQAIAALPASAREALAASRIPMFVFGVEQAPATDVLSDAHWTEVTYSEADFALSLYATDVMVDADEADLTELPEPTETARGERAYFIADERTAALTWIHHDVPYLLSVECDGEEDDVRCREPGFLVSVADTLVPAHVESGR